jgi:alcohol dehydrogenase (cytochrome c)
MFRITLALVLAAGITFGQISFRRLLNASDEPQNWLTYSGTYFSQRYSKLTNLTPVNVKDLEMKWVFQAHSFERYEVTPLVVDRVMYAIQDPNDVVALDAATGRIFWMYSYTPSKDARPGSGRLNRGLAILGNTLFMGTIDARLLALDAKTGRPVWNVEVGDPASGYALTHAPLVIKDKVIVGTAGGEFGIRGYIAAYDVTTGKEVWRFYTVPGKGEPGNETWKGDSWQHGGASVWLTGSYDPELNLTYWGIGNPGPDWNGDDRAGDNLYSCSVVALDADTGKLKWYYQFSPHNEFDWDAVQIPVLVDMSWKGRDGHQRPRKLMFWANRNGIFYVLDRSTGEFLLGKPFVKVTWMTGFDDKGRPIIPPGIGSSEQGTLIFPGNQGGTNWYSPSYSPRTGLFYIPSWVEYSSVFVKQDVTYTRGQRFPGGGESMRNAPVISGRFNYRKDGDPYGAVRAIDPRTGEKKWDFWMADVTKGGVLTTASDLLFSGGQDGYFFALDARDGKLLWKASLGGVIMSSPMTYSVNGKQYVVVCAGNALFAFALR